MLCKEICGHLIAINALTTKVNKAECNKTV